MTREEAIEIVQEAQDKLIEAIDMLADVADAMDDRMADSYIVAHLRCLASDDHGYLDRSYNISKWLNDLERGEDEEDDECES